MTLRRSGAGRSVRVALERMRVSFFIGVALVPALLTQVFIGVQDWMPWWCWASLLLAAIVGLFAGGVRADHRLQRHLVGAQDGIRSVQDIDTITDLVATAHLGKTTPQNVHTLVEALPGVRHVHLVVGEPLDATPDTRAAVESLMARCGRTGLPVQILQHLPIADVDPATVAALEDRLAAIGRLLGPDQRVIVDVTGGTVPMSLATYHAAVGAGLPVTYTSSLPPRSSGGRYRFRGLAALHDPRGELTGGGA